MPQHGVNKVSQDRHLDNLFPTSEDAIEMWRKANLKPWYIRTIQAIQAFFDVLSGRLDIED